MNLQSYISNFKLTPLSFGKIKKCHDLSKVVLIQTNNKLYNGIILKYDANYNIIIRYLDDSIYTYWTGNKDKKCGLDPNIYHGVCIGDMFNDFNNISLDDFVENGYDDIIQFKTEPHRIYKTTKKYPFLAGLEGNTCVHSYYAEMDKLLSNKMYKKMLIPSNKIQPIPELLKNYIDDELQFRGIAYKNNSGILSGVLRVMKFQNNMFEYYSECDDYESIVSSILKYIGYLFNSKSMDKIAKIYGHDIIEKTKQFLIMGYTIDNEILLSIISDIFSCHIYVYSLEDNTNDIEIIEYDMGDTNQIYLYKIKDMYESLF